MVVLCTPLGQMRPLVKQMLPALKPGAIVTDVGSVKATVIRDLQALIANAVSTEPFLSSWKISAVWDELLSTIKPVTFWESPPPMNIGLRVVVPAVYELRRMLPLVRRIVACLVAGPSEAK